MNVDSFLTHHGLTENPFEAEEARHDPVYARMIDSSTNHPDFGKILGQHEPPSTAIVFGEKGSGKTAIRLMISRRVAAHNESNPDRQMLLVVYDDLNPSLDRVVQWRRSRTGSDASVDQLLSGYRLEDHQDAILSLAVTQLVDLILTHKQESNGQEKLRPPAMDQRLKSMPRRLRCDLAVLAALYDQPGSGPIVPRWRKLCNRLRVGRLGPVAALSYAATAATVMTLGLLVGHWLSKAIGDSWPWFMPVTGVTLSASLVLWGLWLNRQGAAWLLSRRLQREMPAVQRRIKAMMSMLLRFRRGDLERQSWPLPSADQQNRRYELTGHLVEVLNAVGFSGLTVVIDRVDEPTLISGKADRMRSLVWPMLDNKFLQQDRVGLKMLLPIELRYMLYRESSDFFQGARLDKQNLIDRLSWSGATLYDMCSSRLRACSDRHETQPISLTDLFETDVTREMLIDALDQMQQPRDAFKFLYNVIQEHCRMSPQDQLRFKIAQLTVDTVRRAQSQRVQELQRGLAPA